ncbi:MAG: AAA family ATPase [Flavobacteriales bacterium]
MIRKIHIKNFKSVRNLSLDLGRINVFIGANGCGKTNILEAIAFAGADAADKLDYEFFSSRGIRVPSLPIHFKSLFDSDGRRENIKIDCQIEVEGELRDFEYDIVYSMIPNQKWFDSRRNDLKGQLEKFILTKSNKDLPPEIYMSMLQGISDSILKQLDNENLERFIIYQPDYQTLRNLFDETQIRPIGIRGEGLLRELQNLNSIQLSKIIEHLKKLDWFESLETNPETPGTIEIKDRFIHEDYNWIDQRSSNEGFLFVLFYLTLFLSQSTPTFFAVDNVESTLNPLLCQNLIHTLTGLAEEQNKQAILTTHSPSVLDGLDLRDDEQRLFVISRNMDGETVAKRIKLDNANSSLNLKLSEKWLRGYLGGLPDNF